MSKMVEESSSKNQRFLKKEKQRRNSDRNLKCQQQKNCNNKGLKKIIGNIFSSGLKKGQIKKSRNFFFSCSKKENRKSENYSDLTKKSNSEIRYILFFPRCFKIIIQKMRFFLFFTTEKKS